MRYLSVAKIFSNGLILQRDFNNKLWGKTRSLSEVVVNLISLEYNYIHKTKSDINGKFEVILPKINDFISSFKIIISSDKEEIIIEDVLFGDVFHISGQSNMELPIYRVKERLNDKINKINNNKIREFRINPSYRFDIENEDVPNGEWKSAESENIYSLSAAGYFFAEEIFNTYGVPVGLVNTAVGGTPIETRMPYEILKKYKIFDSIVEKCKNKNYVEKIKKEQNALYF